VCTGAHGFDTNACRDSIAEKPPPQPILPDQVISALVYVISCFVFFTIVGYVLRAAQRNARLADESEGARDKVEANSQAADDRRRADCRGRSRSPANSIRFHAALVLLLVISAFVAAIAPSRKHRRRKQADGKSSGEERHRVSASLIVVVALAFADDSPLVSSANGQRSKGRHSSDADKAAKPDAKPSEKAEKAERHENKHDKSSDKAGGEKLDKSDKHDKSDAKHDKLDRSDNANKHDKLDKSDKVEKERSESTLEKPDSKSAMPPEFKKINRTAYAFASSSVLGLIAYHSVFLLLLLLFVL
jgi:hypothetical protein